MDWKLFFATFSTIFVAELGDKTQLFTLTLSAQAKSIKEVLLASVLALALAATLGVIAGRVIAHWINPDVMRVISGVLFIGVGVWFLIQRGAAH